jgi:hypothetical protein
LKKNNNWAYFHAETLTRIIEAELCCPYCGVPITASNLSLDSIDNDKPHYADNVVVTDWPCNNVRKDFYIFEEFIAVCQALRAFRNKLPSVTFEISPLINIFNVFSTIERFFIDLQNVQ